MDIAREELTKKPEEISVEKLQVPFVLCCLFFTCHGEHCFFAARVMITDELTLCFCVVLWQSLVDIALRSTAAASDPSHEDLTCCVVSLLSGSSQIVQYLLIIIFHISCETGKKFPT
jgi:gamma-tubulin complex component 2